MEMYLGLSYYCSEIALFRQSVKMRLAGSSGGRTSSELVALRHGIHREIHGHAREEHHRLQELLRALIHQKLPRRVSIKAHPFLLITFFYSLNQIFLYTSHLITVHIC